MKKMNFGKDILPHLIAVIVFSLVCIIYFSPIFFQNKSINQYDIQQWYGGAYQLEQYRETTGEEGLWAESLFSGMPAYLVSIDWSNGVVEGLQKVYTLFMPHPVKYVFAAFLSFYILLLAFKVRPYVAMIGAVGFGLSSFMIIGLVAGHNARVGAIAFMPLVMAGIHILFNRKYLLGFALLSVGLALELRVNHLQITYYLFIIAVIYGLVNLYYAYRDGEIQPFFKSVGIGILAAIVAVGTFFGEFWGTYEYSKYSMRGKSELSSTVESGENVDGLEKSYAFNYSNGIFEPLTLLIPNVLGGASSNYFAADQSSESFRAIQRNADPQSANQLARFTSSYWGSQPLAAPYYAGAIICFLFVLGIIYADKKYKIWLLVVFVLGIVLSWGSNFAAFNYFIFDYLPGYNKFRSVTFTLVMALFAMGLLGGLGLEKFLQEKPIKIKSLGIAWGATAGLALLLILIGGMFDFRGPYDDQLPAWFSGALKADRLSLLRSDAFRTFIFITLVASILFAFVKGKLKGTITCLLIFLLSLIDLWVIDIRFLNEDNFRKNATRSFFVETDADKAIKQQGTGHYRVLNLISPMNEARTSYFHNSLGGYHGAKMRRYQDLYENGLQPQIQGLIKNLQAGRGGFEQYGIINMLNTRFLKAGNAANMIIPNASALGNGWFVSEVVKVNSPDEEIALVPELDTRSKAVIDVSQNQLELQSYSQNGQVELVDYKPNSLRYSVSSDQGGLAVFSEIYYPKGWVASIDGEEVNILRANYVLRALEIPSGVHEVLFEYKPAPYFVGNTITMIFNYLLLLVILATGYFEFRNFQAEGKAA